MPSFMIAYHGEQKSEGPEKDAEHMAKYQAWLGGLGEAATVPMQPFKASKTVRAGGVEDSGPERMIGYTMVTADSLEAAIEMAQACPYLDKGDLVVSELMEMKR